MKPNRFLYLAFAILSLLVCSDSTLQSRNRIDTRWKVPAEIHLNKPSQDAIYDVAVIGGGAAGTMAANRSVLNNDKVLFVLGERKTEQQARGLWVPKFSNTPALTQTKRPVVAIRNTMLENIATGLQRDRLYVIENSIDHIQKDKQDRQDIFTLKSSAGHEYRARYVILATGTMDVQPNINGNIRPILTFSNRQQAVYCLRCDGHLAVDKKNVVVFGDSSATADGAILLAERYSIPNISILTNGKDPSWNQKQSDLLARYRIQVISKMIMGLEDRKRKILTRVRFSDGSVIPADFAVVSLGTQVNNSLAQQLGAQLDQRGFVTADADGLTSVDNLYVAGDLKANTRKQVYVAWDTGVRAAEAINKKIRSLKRKALKAVSY